MDRVDFERTTEDDIMAEYTAKVSNDFVFTDANGTILRDERLSRLASSQ